MLARTPAMKFSSVRSTSSVMNVRSSRALQPAVRPTVTLTMTPKRSFHNPQADPPLSIPDNSGKEWITKYLKEVKLDYNEKYSKHISQVKLDEEAYPKIANSSFVAPSATLIGNVELWDNSIIWENVVVRGDINLVRIGSFTNIQDGVVIHEAFEPLNPDHDGSSIIGHYVSVGPNSQLTAVTIEDECVIGAGSILLEGAYMEVGSVLGRGSLVPANTRIPSNQFWTGSPARYVRDLTDRERDWIVKSAVSHIENTATDYKEQFEIEPVQYQERFDNGLDEHSERHVSKQI